MYKSLRYYRKCTNLANGNNIRPTSHSCWLAAYNQQFQRDLTHSLHWDTLWDNPRSYYTAIQPCTDDNPTIIRRRQENKNIRVSRRRSDKWHWLPYTAETTVPAGQRRAAGRWQCWLPLTHRLFPPLHMCTGIYRLVTASEKHQQFFLGK